jgi:hypothetical protein
MAMYFHLILFSLIFSQSWAEGLSTAEIRAKANVAAYCKNGKQVKALKEVFTAKIQKPPTGIPLDEYQQILSKRKQNAREWAKTLFLLHLGISGEPSSNYDRSEDLKAIGLSRNGKPISMAWYDMNSLEVLDSFRRHYAFTFPRQVQDKIFTSHNLPVELWDSECKSSDEAVGDVGYISLDSNCKFSPSQAIYSTPRAWEVYAIRFTQFKEATGNDPLSINFEVGLDLNYFCSYHIPLSELLAK